MTWSAYDEDKYQQEQRRRREALLTGTPEQRRQGYQALGKTDHNPQEMTIYDVLAELVTAAKWPDEGALNRRLKAIQTAKENFLFGNEGNYKL